MRGKLLIRLFRTKKFEVPRDYRELDNENFHVKKNIITVTKRKLLTLEFHAGRVGKTGENYILIENS
jgi:hypothetical protein